MSFNIKFLKLATIIEKLFLKLAKKQGYKFRPDFGFFDFCFYMATIAFRELKEADEHIDDHDILTIMGINMMHYKKG